MELSEIEEKLDEIKAIGKANTEIVLGIDGNVSGFQALATILNFISLEIGLLIRCNIEILRKMDENDPS